MATENQTSPLIAAALGVTTDRREPGLSQLFLEAQLIRVMAERRVNEVRKDIKPKNTDAKL